MKVVDAINYLMKEGFQVITWQPEKIVFHQIIKDSYTSEAMDGSELRQWVAGYTYHKNFVDR